MAIQNTNQQAQNENAAVADVTSKSYETSLQTRQTYHEMSDIPVQDVSDLAELEMNLKTLNDLQNRLSFVMREVRYLMKV